MGSLMGLVWGSFWDMRGKGKGKVWGIRGVGGECGWFAVLAGMCFNGTEGA